MCERIVASPSVQRSCHERGPSDAAISTESPASDSAGMTMTGAPIGSSAARGVYDRYAVTTASPKTISSALHAIA